MDEKDTKPETGEPRKDVVYLMWPEVWSGGDYECYTTCRLCSYSENLRPQHDPDCIQKAKEIIRLRREKAVTAKDFAIIEAMERNIHYQETGEWIV